MSRLTPWDLAFAGDVEQRFGSVQSEAARAMKNADDFAQFISLQSVQHIIDDIESPELLTDDPAAAAEYHTLLYTAFRFWTAGKRVLPVPSDFLRAVGCELHALPSATQVPGGACYLQLPEHRIWAQVDPTAPHEPVDGLFVAQSPDLMQLTAVAVLGLRQGRGGFSQISVTVALADLTELQGAVRAPPFEPTMDGGVEAGFKSVISVGELLLLTQLALVHATS
jgi:hypothetical protein